jgi:hypothetical protein
VEKATAAGSCAAFRASAPITAMAAAATQAAMKLRMTRLLGWIDI